MNEMNNCIRCGKAAPGPLSMGVCKDCLLSAGLGSVADATSSGTARFTPPGAEDIAPLFPQLEVEGLLGHGGMGAVYKARQKNLDRAVALKILPPDIGGDPAFSERFTREAMAMARLSHANIVTLYEFGRAGDLYYFLMEYVDGVNLGQLIGEGRMTPCEALAIVPQICDALQYAHGQGIVHRDIKPENILLDRLGRVKVADFGIAKLVSVKDGAGSRPRHRTCPGTAQPSLVIGTPAYMAPEQSEKPSAVDHRADIYSLGVVFYQMLTGELPGKPLEAPSRKVTVDVRLDEVVLRALEREPERRYQHAGEVRTLVETISATSGGNPAKGARPGRAGWRGGRPALKLAAAALLVLSLRQWVLGAYMIRQDSLAPEIPAGSLVMAWKPARDFAPGDLVVYRQDRASMAGRVRGVMAQGVLVNRNRAADTLVPHGALLGRIVKVLWRGPAAAGKTPPISPPPPRKAPDPKADALGDAMAKAAEQAAAEELRAVQAPSTPEGLASNYVAAVNAKDAGRLEALIHPRCLAGITPVEAQLIRETVDRQLRRTIPEGCPAVFSPATQPGVSVSIAASVVWRIKPTHQFKLEYDGRDGGHVTIMVPAVEDRGRWYIAQMSLNEEGLKRYAESRKGGPGAAQAPARAAAPGPEGIVSFTAGTPPYDGMARRPWAWEVRLGAEACRSKRFQVVQRTQALDGGEGSPKAPRVIAGPGEVRSDAGGGIGFNLYAGEDGAMTNMNSSVNIGLPVTFSGAGTGVGTSGWILLPGTRILDRTLHKAGAFRDGGLPLAEWISGDGKGRRYRTVLALEYAEDGAAPLAPKKGLD